MSNPFCIVIVRGSEVGKKLTFNQEIVNIGRTVQDNDMVLNDHSISGKHARITSEEGTFFLQDLGSTNKTYFKDSALKEGEKIRIQRGDEFSLGKIVLKFLGPTDEKRGSDEQGASSETRVVDVEAHSKRGGFDGVLSLKRKPILVVGIAVGLLLLILAIFKVSMQPATTPPKHPDNSRQPIALPAKDTYGYCKPDRTHPDKAIFTFVAESGAASLYYTVGGIDSDGEVVILLNDTKVANAPLAMSGWGNEEVFHLPREALIEGGENRIVFDSTMNPPEQNQWGVQNVRVEFLPVEVCDEREGEHLFTLGNKMYEEKEVDDGNVYRAYEYYSEAVSKVEECTSKPALLTEMENKLKTAKSEVETRYNSLVFSYKKSIQLKNYSQAKNDLEAILRLIPDAKDKRNKETVPLLERINNFLAQRR